MTDVNNVKEILGNIPNVIRKFPEKTALSRVQPSKYDDEPRNYRKDSDTRFADPDKKVGVFYAEFSDAVAIAESFQPGQGVDNQAVDYSMLEQSSLHQLEMARELKLVDLSKLATRVGFKLRDVVQAKGQGREGYMPTRALSQACMQYGEEIDGLIYESAVYSSAGTLEGCNVVLFEGRGTQVKPVSHKSLLEVELPTGETVVQLLENLGVILE